jgi:hypothetical protein
METNFTNAMACISDDLARTTAINLAAQLDERADYEIHKNPENANIHRTLKKARTVLATPTAARVLLAAAVDPVFVNAIKRDGARRNVYSFGKMADLVGVLTREAWEGNAINNAIVRSLIRLTDKGVAFTFETAKAACSKTFAYEGEGRRFLVRHTVAPSTAPTQASSTMEALVEMGVVNTSGGKNARYWLRNEAPIVEHLRAVLGLPAPEPVAT